MITIRDILEKNNIKLNLKESILSFELEEEYDFQEIYLESNIHYGCPCDKKYIKAIFFENKYSKENIVLYPEMESCTLWVSKCLSYFDENGKCVTTLEI